MVQVCKDVCTVKARIQTSELIVEGLAAYNADTGLLGFFTGNHICMQAHTTYTHPFLCLMLFNMLNCCRQKSRVYKAKGGRFLNDATYLMFRGVFSLPPHHTNRKERSKNLSPQNALWSGWEIFGFCSLEALATEWLNPAVEKFGDDLLASAPLSHRSIGRWL